MKNIVLIGFMGTGKTTVGRILAEKTGRSFVDCDRVIESDEKRSITDIFAVKGETYFRSKEAEVIARIAKMEDQVIATGGGAVMNPASFDTLRNSGVVVGLLAGAESIGHRLERCENRPLIAVEDRKAVIEKLMEERMPVYRQADILIDTDIFPSPAAVAEEVMDRLNTQSSINELQQLQVDLGDRSYEIVIGPRILETLGEKLRCLEINNPLLLISNPKVSGLYLNIVEESLRSAGWQVQIAIVPDGETYKSLEEAGKLYDAAIRGGLERKSAIIALGGGVIGDLSGFIAATYQRGINFIQLPTTLLAQVDSAVGGKVAVNHPLGKNMIGSFYQPRLVMADLATLRTLDPRDYASGLAEVVKSAFIRDEALFSFLERNYQEINLRDLKILGDVVARVCRIKADVVGSDEKEIGIRAILNFGHTVGHAVEAATEYREYRHGEAVSMGMAVAVEIAIRMGQCAPEVASRLNNLLGLFQLPIKLPGLSVDKLVAAMKMDKKADQGSVGFVLPSAVGQTAWGCKVPEKILFEVLLDMGAVKE